MFKLFTRHYSQIGWLLRGRLVFISYRRNDSFDISGRIYDRLSRMRGDGRVIRDVESFPIGCDFLAYIEDAIRNSRAVIAVIGPDWCVDRAAGRRYFDNADDVLTFELVCARRLGIPIYPVLVNGARLPSAKVLPPELSFIAGLHATRVRSDLDFHADIERLQRAIDQGGRIRRNRPSAELFVPPPARGREPVYALAAFDR